MAASDDYRVSMGQRTVGGEGEFGLIAQITQGLAMGPAVSVGPGDDGAVFLVNGSAVASIDLLVEGSHFRRAWVPPRLLGRRSVAVAAADLEAMGADQVAVLVGLTLPPETETDWVKDLATGVRDECEKAGASLIGGDITRGPNVTIAVTVIGELRGRQPVLRSGARPGDAVAVRGRLGWAAGGLAVLSRGFRSPRALVEAYQCPDVAYGAGPDAQRQGATSLIDVSDGLLADLGHIAEESGVRIDLDAERFEIAEPLQALAAATGGKDPLMYVLTGGEDHALAGTFPWGRVPPEWTVVGRVCDDEPGVLVDGEPYDGPAGWDHFARR